MSSPLTIKATLQRAESSLSHSDTPQLDCEVLLAHALVKSRTYLRAWPEKKLSTHEEKVFNQLIEKRGDGTPVAYIVGEREFWSRSFCVTPDVLIPRPDTELLIEIIQRKFAPQQSFCALDLGTGSGAIAITLALEFINARITAVDSSTQALAVANGNAQRLKAHNLNFINSNWFHSIPHAPVDLIVSNPPYIDPTDPHLSEGDVRFEPQAALIAEHKGLQDIKDIIHGAFEFLKPSGILLFEHGYQQGNDVKNLLESSGFKLIEQFNDIQGHTRATLGIRP